MRLLALDGIYLQQTRTVEHLALLQSSRASVAVMCAAVGTFYLQSATTFDAASSYSSIGDTQTKSNQNLLTLQVAGYHYIMSAPPTDLSSITRPTAIVTPPSNSASGISISTAQGGCCTPTPTPVIDGSASALCPTTAATTSYWLGMGSDCRLACYGRVLCSALHSVLTASDSDSVSDTFEGAYSVATFPTVRNGECAYSSFAGYASDTTTNSDGSAVCAQNPPSSLPDSAAIAAATATVPAGTPTAQLGAVQTLTLWGHSDFTYPLFIQGNVLQVGAYGAVDSTVSNIVGSGDYSPYSTASAYAASTVYNSSHYAQQGDWKETWPALTGEKVGGVIFFIFFIYGTFAWKS